MATRLYPVGIQTFEEIINNNLIRQDGIHIPY